LAEIAIAVKVYGGDERNARLALARKSANIISLGNKPRDAVSRDGQPVLIDLRVENLPRSVLSQSGVPLGTTEQTCFNGSASDGKLTAAKESAMV